MEFVPRSRFCRDLKYFVEYAELQWHTWNGEWWLEYKIWNVRCNVIYHWLNWSSQLRTQFIQLIARRVISSYHFRRFQTMMNLCWVGCWNRVPGTTEISVFVSLVHSLPCSQSLHCHRAQESEVFQKANARRSLPSSRRVRTFAPMYQGTYVLTLNEFLFHESLFKVSEKQRLLTHIFTLSNAMSSEEVQWLGLVAHATENI